MTIESAVTESPIVESQQISTNEVEQAAGQESLQQPQPIEDPRKVWESEKRKLFTVMTKKDKEFREREQQIKQQEQRLQLAEKYERLKAIARDNPEEVLQEIGLDYRYLTEYYMNNSQTPESEKQNRILKEIDDLKKQREEEIKAKEESKKQSEQQQNAQAVVEYAKGIKTHVEQNVEKYPLVAANWREAIEVSIKYAAFVVQKTGEVPSNEFLIGEVEKYFDQKLSPLLQNHNIRTKYGLSTTPVSGAAANTAAKNDINSQEVKLPSSKVKAGKTLTNQHSIGATEKQSDSGPYDPVEARKRAAALLKFN